MTKNPHAKTADAPSKRATSQRGDKFLDCANVAALFVSGRSIYRHLPYVRCYGERENAQNFSGHLPIVAHPPCGPWSKCLRHQYSEKRRVPDMALGVWAVGMVLNNGGVLEQPAGSLLWAACQLPKPSDKGEAFLYSVYLEQSWFGFFSRKPTWVLVSGVPRQQLPPIPISLNGNGGNCMRLSKFGRSRTMRPFAEWLCQAARASWWQHRK